MRSTTTHFKSRMFLYALLLIAVYLLQFTRGVRITLFGTSADILPFFVAALALFEGAGVGAVFGFVAGLLCTIGTGSAEGLLALYYGLCGLAFGHFSSRYMRRVFPTTLLCGSIIFALKAIVVFCFYYVLVYKATNLAAFKTVGIQLVLSAAFAVPIHFIIAKISSKLEDAEQ